MTRRALAVLTATLALTGCAARPSAPVTYPGLAAVQTEGLCSVLSDLSMHRSWGMPEATASYPDDYAANDVPDGAPEMRAAMKGYPRASAPVRKAARRIVRARNYEATADAWRSMGALCWPDR